jgi:hypothetical protein
MGQLRQRHAINADREAGRVQAAVLLPMAVLSAYAIRLFVS